MSGGATWPRVVVQADACVLQAAQHGAGGVVCAACP